LKIFISQGSAATQLRCGLIFSNDVIANFPQNVLVKQFKKKRSIFGKDMDQVWKLTFLTHPVYAVLQASVLGDAFI